MRLHTLSNSYQWCSKLIQTHSLRTVPQYQLQQLYSNTIGHAGAHTPRGVGRWGSSRKKSWWPWQTEAVSLHSLHKHPSPALWGSLYLALHTPAVHPPALHPPAIHPPALHTLRVCRLLSDHIFCNSHPLRKRTTHECASYCLMTFSTTLIP